jgi:hypothetical protein
MDEELKKEIIAGVVVTGVVGAGAYLWSKYVQAQLTNTNPTQPASIGTTTTVGSQSGNVGTTSTQVSGTQTTTVNNNPNNTNTSSNNSVTVSGNTPINPNIDVTVS